MQERDALHKVEKERDALCGELRGVTVERDLLKQRVQAHRTSLPRNSSLPSANSMVRTR